MILCFMHGILDKYFLVVVPGKSMMFSALLMISCPLCVHAGSQCVLERSAAALVGAGLVHRHLLTYCPSGSVIQQPGCSAVCGAVGSDPPANSRSF